MSAFLKDVIKKLCLLKNHFFKRHSHTTYVIKKIRYVVAIMKYYKKDTVQTFALESEIRQNRLNQEDSSAKQTMIQKFPSMFNSYTNDTPAY